MKKLIIYGVLGMMSFSFASCDSLIKNILGSDDEDEPEQIDNPTGNTSTKVDPTVYFPFNGDYNDLSGNDYYGFGSPEPSFTNGVTGGTKALSFTKTGKEAFIVPYGLIDTKSMTVCLWAKNISQGNIFYVTSSNKGDGGEEMMTFTYRDGHLKYVVSRYANHYTFDSTGNFTHTSIDNDEWHHLALVSDYNTLNYAAVTTSLYIDGKLMDTITEKINPFTEEESGERHYGTGTKFILGGSMVPSMQIAHLRVYDYRMLSADEIRKLYETKK